MEVCVDINVDNIVYELDRKEKKRLLKYLLADNELMTEKERLEKERDDRLAEEFRLMQALEGMSLYELKKTLCNLLDVPSYADEDGLRAALEKIIKA